MPRCLAITACSGTTFVYNRLDTILPHVDDYVDLDSPQRQLLDQTLQPFLRWHRQQELPALRGPAGQSLTQTWTGR